MSINIKTDKGLVKIAPTSYNELTDLPNIKSNGNTTYITDKSGNNVATIDSGGISTIGIVVDRITLDGEDVGTKLDSIKGEIDFNDLTNNPITDNNDGTVSFADKSGNKIVLIDSEGVTSVEFNADGHKLTEKADQSYVDNQITRVEELGFSGDYNDLTNTPIVNDTTGSAIFADEQGNQIAKIDAEGVESIEFKAGNHKLTEKANQSDVNAAITNLENAAFSGDYNDLENAPIDNINDGTILFTDELGNKIGQIDESGFTSTEFIAGSHKLTNKAEHNAPLANFAEDSEHQLVSSSEKTYWSNKSDFSGKFSDLEENPIIDNKDGQIEYQDNEGNTIVRIDSLGISTTAISINEGDVATLINSKVDKISGKQLSTEDFTTALKNKLLSLNNFDSTELENAIQGLQNQLNTLVSGNASEAIESFNEIISFLDGIKDTLDLSSIIASIERQINLVKYNVSFDNIINNPIVDDKSGELNIIDESGNIGIKVTTDGVYVKDVTAGSHTLSNKQDIITDLDTIRQGAAKGASALQSIPSEYVTDAELINKGYATNSYVNTELEKKQNTITDLATIRSGAAKGATALQSYTETDPVFKASAAANITTTDITNWNNKTSNSGTITEVKANGTSIATSGSANIPAASTSVYGVTKLSSSTSSTSEALAATPKAVKAAYDLAASKTSNTGTITGITMNGVSKGTSGVVDLGTVVTNVSNLASKTELTDAINNIDFYAIKDNPIIEEASGTLTFADPSGNIGFVFEGNSIHVQDVTTGTHTLSNKQDLLVSGTNIKTINGASILGSGNINITGGSSITESTISGWGFTKNTGTVTGVKINGSTKNPSSGVVDLGTVITSHQDISGKADKSSLATVATSGNYNDLTNKPTIPTKVSQLENDIHYIKGKRIVIGDSTGLNLDPDIYYTTDIKSDLTVSIKDNLSSTTLPVHFFGMFSFGNTVYNITWPSNIKWVSRPSYYEANSQYHYEIVFGLNYTFGKIYKIADDLIANTSDAINIYTIDIRDWDLKSDKEISITNEDAARILNADIIRFLYEYILSDDLSLLCYLDTTLSVGVGDEREGMFSYTGFTETGTIVATISNLFDNTWSMTLSAYNNAYRRSAFFIGEYDEETDNWDNSLIADILEQNVVAFKNLYYITLNPSEFNDRTSIQVMEATGDISIINKYRYLEDEEVMEMIYERYDIDSKNKTVWLIVIGKDGVPSYQKIL